MIISFGDASNKKQSQSDPTTAVGASLSETRIWHDTPSKRPDLVPVPRSPFPVPRSPCFVCVVFAAAAAAAAAAAVAAAAAAALVVVVVVVVAAAAAAVVAAAAAAVAVAVAVDSYPHAHLDMLLDKTLDDSS